MSSPQVAAESRTYRNPPSVRSRYRLFRVDNEVPTELGDYLRTPDLSFAWRSREGFLDLTSQTWQGIPWRHVVSLSEGVGDLAILILTGGDPNELDLAEQRLLAERSGLPVATLFHIPNQPLYDLWEDDLIAHTFEQYLKFGDPSWPLLMPMVKSAIRAMDVIQEATDGRIRRFVITGASKRGWTTWLTAASGDPRIEGIVPIVIDNLNVAAQMRHQIETWGQYSEMIEAYTDRGLPDKVETPEGARLARIIDPFSYRSQIDVPTLVINGTNDPYWQVDAMSLYWEDLRQPKWSSIVPNAGHNPEDKTQWHEALCAFARSIAGEFEMPAPKWIIEVADGHVTASATGVMNLQLWAATSRTLDFRESEWRLLTDTRPDHLATRPQGDVTTEAGCLPEHVKAPSALIQTGYPLHVEGGHINWAVLLSTRYTIDGCRFRLTSPVAVFRSQQQ